MLANNPILDSPFRAPDRHWRPPDESGEFGQIVESGRRRSEYFVCDCARITAATGDGALLKSSIHIRPKE
jgi:hypothetical protein